jgi:hypothetical protein
MSERIVRIVESNIKPPYNLLSLADGQSVEFVAVKIEEGHAKREIVEGSRKIALEGPILRVHAAPGTFVFGAPYIDILAGRTIAALTSLFKNIKKPIKLKLTARGREPDKWYEIEWSVVE